MIIDRDLMFSNEYELTKSGASEVIDLGEAGDAIGQELTLHVIVSAAFAGLTSLAIAVQTGTDGKNFADVVMSPAIPAAKLTAGATPFCVRVPKGLGRYVRLNYTVVGSATAGKITAFASKDL
jgi:hypothetical protein